MKNIQINKVKYSSNGSAVIGVQKETVALPDLKKDILYVDGTEEYFTVKGVKTDGSYWGGYFLFQQADIVTVSEPFTAFINYVSSNNIGGYSTFNKEYLETITKYDAKEEDSAYGAYRANFRKSLLDFLNTDGTVFEAKVTQSLQDTKQLEMLAKTWENTITSNVDFVDSYRQGKLPMFVNKPAILSMLVKCATCGNLENGGLTNPYNVVGSSYPGANVKVFENYEFYNGVSMQDIDNQLAEGIATALDEACSRFSNRLKGEDFNELQEECKKSLQEAIKNLEEQFSELEDEIATKKEEKDELQTEISEQEEVIAKANSEISDLNDQLEDAAKTYADCLDAAGSDPVAIEACNNAYNTSKAEIEAELKEVEATKAKAEAELLELQTQLADLELEISNLTNQKDVIEAAIRNNTSQLENQEKCKDKVETFCGEAPSGN